MASGAKGEMVQPAALKHGLRVGGTDAGNLEWMQQDIRPDFNTGMTITFFLKIEQYLGFEDAGIEIDEAVQIGRYEGQMMNAIE